MSLSAFHSAAPKVGVILGSGLGTVAEALGIEATVSYAAVPGLRASTVPGHVGRFVLARLNGQAIVIAQGRSHLYEGLTAVEVTAHVRCLHEMGVQTLLLTNAAGAINASFEVGHLMLLSDHLNLTGTSPLLGGPNFRDMTEVYSLRLRECLMETAEREDLPLHEGVYAGLLGPQYETPAEVRMLGVLGADAVGMSTVLEAIQARALGMEVAGISTLTNWAAGLGGSTLDHHEVIEIGRQAANHLQLLIQGLVKSVA
jgi:purine-nucleoside phosphorylase